jgi:hypothetical protein
MAKNSLKKTQIAAEVPFINMLLKIDTQKLKMACGLIKDIKGF